MLNQRTQYFFHRLLITGFPILYHVEKQIARSRKVKYFKKGNVKCKKKGSLLLVIFLIFANGLFAKITTDEITGSLKKNLRHPCLYFTEQEKPAILQRIKSDPESRDIMAKLLTEANCLLFTPVEKQVPVQQKNPRYWTDGKAIRYVSQYRQAAQNLAFVYQMTGKKKYAQKAFEFADALCDLKSWVYRAHEFPIIYSRVWPWNVKDDQVVFNFDIRTGDMARELAAVYDWLYPALDKRQRDRIRGALLEKAILLARGNYDYHWWASAYRCNWCGICFSGLGVASLALLTEEPQLADMIAESYNRINKMFDEIGIDGGWQAFIKDLGSAKYDEKYFDETRWNYPQASSAGHNLVFVNGELQISAKYKNRPRQKGVGGKVIEFRTSPNRDYTLMDPTNAYPGKELKGWRRHIILEKPNITLILDEVKTKKNAEIETRFHSDCSIVNGDGFLLLKGHKGTMVLIPVIDEDFYFRKGKHPYLPVQKNAVFEWIPYFGTVVNAKNEKTIIITLILPVEEKSKMLKTVESIGKNVDAAGNLMLSFKYRRNSYAFTFEKIDGQLRLSK